ncbi:uncharacterized protein LOC121253459 [Juglans microcarpa x Juglans regia]|uniref:uncharacterized protein LOC121253459 n=1 Tax=Juglans microcarpa x Juglans regia TaxID=2249226 RepID=UPI001B7E639B|nr:uncharacterized protein LOC121253459 [Juglans microcarpa x Juglans regia]
MALRLSEEELELVATVLRNLWLRRNIFIFEKKFTSPDTIQFKEANYVGGRVSNHNNRELVRWSKPRDGASKVNWDVAFVIKNKKMGAEIVIRDHLGDIFMSACMPNNYVMSSAQVEAIALWRALKLCEEVQVGRAEFEGDALSVVKAVNREYDN